MSEQERARMSGEEGRERLMARAMPEGYRAELRRMEVEAVGVISSVGRSVLVFQLGGLRLALPTTVAAAVAPVLHIARIPHRSGTVLEGVVAFRGMILPCVSLKRLLSLAEDAPHAGAGRMLILEEVAGRYWAAPIDGVVGVQPDPGAAVETDGTAMAQWSRGCVEDKDGTISVLDAEVLFRQMTLATA